MSEGRIWEDQGKDGATASPLTRTRHMNEERIGSIPIEKEEEEDIYSFYPLWF